MDNANNITDQVAKVPYDPGWNDPPKFSYNTQQNTPNRPRNFLNKRVAFPLSNATSSPAPPSSVQLPPMPTAAPVPSLPITNTLLEENIVIDSANTLEEVREILLNFLDSCTELGPKSNDIKRRISVMEDMWSSGKLNNNIYLQMKNLAYALRDNMPSKADDIHRALMVDHVSAVGTWMPGVKQLIHHCIARSELLAIEKEESNEMENN